MKKFALISAATLFLAGCGSIPLLSAETATSLEDAAASYDILSVADGAEEGTETASGNVNTSNRAEIAFSRLDSNADGGISLAELSAAFAWETELSDEKILSMFEALDGDQDDALSLEELKAEEDRQQAECKDGKKGPKPRRMRQARSSLLAFPPFHAAPLRLTRPSPTDWICAATAPSCWWRRPGTPTATCRSS